ncbi:helix-turn-helix domain-containing protein [Rhodococcus artemisiae]|uniref:Helix-turn-helix transcriptional regulator n=1 Tax=Rhodococcus artemisiae TaxID=714159 RepID=A0ABU7L9P2_9NOCA|nr:helix-turn-helix transcriptional regulator [Rhodococcus artemisiae]MEE2058261.1 helix-turn-helix transcriptional regulator [Rhodococcus artemisiae]
MTEPSPIDSLGPTGVHVARNVQRLRETRNLSFADLSRELAKIGRHIPTLGLRKIESLRRRVDTDDLVALAIVFDVSPATLLMPHAYDMEEWSTGRSALTDPDAKYRFEVVWDWLVADAPLVVGAESPNGRQMHAFRLNAVPEHAYMRKQLGFDADGRARRHGDD